MTETVTIDAGTLTANYSDRTVTGLLLPYGEECRSNLGTFSVDPGSFTIPADVPGVVGLNVEHHREASVGRAQTLTDTPQGVVATFSVARTPEGDLVLEDIRTGKRKHLSVEASGIQIKDKKAIAGQIFGAAIVAAPAFPSATLLASAPDTPIGNDLAKLARASAAQHRQSAEEYDRLADLADPPEDPEPDPDPDQPAEDPTPDQSPQTPGPEGPEPTPDDDKEGTDMGTATAPDTLHAAQVAAPDTSLRALSTLMASRQTLGGDPQYRNALAEFDAAGSTLFGALSDVKISGAAGAGVMTGVQLPQAIGELWTRVAYQRRIVPLMSAGQLTSLTIQGWRWQAGKAPAVDTWAGNKANVPSPAVQTEAYNVTADRLAGAYDVAREFIDFDVPGFWESFWNAMTASYAQKSDTKALADVAAAATPVTAEAPATGVNAAINLILAGVAQVIQYGTPAFGVISPELFAAIASITNAGSFPYLSVGTVSFPVYGPNVTVAGIPVIPGAVGTGKALVAAREAATFYELPGSPIRVEGVYDMARGGVNPGLFGYFATVVHQAQAIALVSPTAGP